MAAPPSPPPVSLASFPVEVLEAIVGFIPLRPRLRVVSLVSRRLLLAVRNSVRSGDGRNRFVLDELPPSSLHHFTNLTSLRINWRHSRAISSAHFPHLRSFTADTYSSIFVDFIHRCPSLTSLSVFGYVTAPQLLDFLAPHATSLTALEIPHVSPPLFDGSPLTLPNLSWLVSPSGLGLGCLHAPALTHLDTEGSAASTPHLLRLHRLSSLNLLINEVGEHTAELYRWMLSLTQLTRLGVNLPWPFGPYGRDIRDFISHAPALTSLEYAHSGLDPATAATLLAPQTKLRTLSLGCLPHSTPVIPLLSAVGSRLTDLDLHLIPSLRPDTVRPQLQALTQHVTNLQKVQLYERAFDLFTPEWRLPHLRRMDIITGGYNEGKEAINIARIVSILTAYPSLQCVYLRLGSHSKWDATGEELEALFAYCAQHRPRVRIFFVDMSSEFARHVARLSRLYPWLPIMTAHKS